MQSFLRLMQLSPQGFDFPCVQYLQQAHGTGGGEMPPSALAIASAATAPPRTTPATRTMQKPILFMFPPE